MIQDQCLELGQVSYGIGSALMFFIFSNLFYGHKVTSNDRLRPSW